MAGEIFISYGQAMYGPNRGHDDLPRFTTGGQQSAP
jgi:hypothetical protein